MADIAELEKRIEEQIIGNTEIVSKVTAKQKQITAGTEAATSAIVSAVVSKGESEAAVVRQENHAALKSQQSAQDIFAAAGGPARILDLNERKFNFQNEADARLDAIVAKENIDFLDDPIGWIGAQFTLGDDIDEFQLSQAQANLAAANINSITSRTVGAANAVRVTEERITEASINESANAIAQSNIVEANKARLESFKTGSDVLLRTMQMSQAALDNSMSQLRLEDAKAARVIRVKEHEQSKARFKIVKEQYTTSKEAQEAYIASVQQGQALLKMKILEPAVIRGLKDAGGEQAKQLDLIASEGAVSTGQVGLTPADSFILQSRFNPTELTDTTNPATTALGVAGANMEAEFKKPQSGGRPKGKDAAERIKTAYNNEVDKLFKGYEAEIVPGDTSNPNHAPPADVVSQFQAVKDSAFYQKVLKDAEVDYSDIESVVAFAAEGIQKKKVSMPEVLSGFNAIYNSIMANNNTQQQRFRHNLPAQLTYNARVPNIQRDIARKQLVGAGTFLALEEFQEITPPGALQTFISVDAADTSAIANYITLFISNQVGPDAANFDLQ